MLKNISIPDVNSSGLFLKNATFGLPVPGKEDINITNIAAKNEIKFDAAKLHAVLKANFEFKKGIFDVKGFMELDIINDGLGIHIPLDLGTQPGTPSYDLAPKITVTAVEIDLDPKNVDIKLTGGAVARIAKILIPLIKDTILPAIIKKVETAIPKIINTTIDQDLAKYGTQLKIPGLAGVTLDIGQLMGSPKINTDSSFTLAVNGTFFDANKPAASTLHPATFTPSDLKGHMLEVYLTSYVLNTMFDAGFSTGQTIDISHLLSMFNITVTTGELGVAIPEFITKYGSDKPVDISVGFVNKPSVATINATGAGLDANLKVAFKVGTDLALGGDMNDIKLHADLHASKNQIFGKIDQDNLGTWTNF